VVRTEDRFAWPGIDLSQMLTASAIERSYERVWQLRPDSRAGPGEHGTDMAGDISRK
jgi:hypothetical protein